MIHFVPRPRGCDTAIASLCVLALLPVAVRAADESEWSIFVGASHTDNLELASANQRSDIQPEAGFNWIFRDKRQRLDTALAANLAYKGYPSQGFFNNRKPDSLTGAADLSLQASVIPDRFLWMLAETFGQTAVDLSSPSSPSNRQNTNVLSTGPRFMWPLGARSELQLDAVWFTSDFGASRSDSSGYKATAALKHRTSQVGALSFQVSESRINAASQQANGDYKLHSASFSWNKVTKRTSLSTELGYSDLAVRGTNQRSPLVKVTFSRKLSTRSSISATVAREFSSAAEAFQANQNFFGVTGTLVSGQSTAEPFRADFGQISWTAQGSLIEFSVQARLRRETYESSPNLNARFYGVGITADRALSSRLRIGVHAQHDRRQFNAQLTPSREQRLGADVTFASSSTVSVTFGYEHFSGNGFGGRDYVENRELLRIAYRPRSGT